MATPDLSEFDELTAPRHVRARCKVDQGLEGLSEADVVNVTAAIASPHYTAGAIERWFARRDRKVSANAVTIHRKRRCACADA